MLCLKNVTVAHKVLYEATYEVMPLILVSDFNQLCTSTGQLKQSVAAGVLHQQ